MITIPAEAPPPLPGATLDAPSAEATTAQPAVSPHARLASAATSEYAEAATPQSAAILESNQPATSTDTWQSQSTIYEVAPRPTQPNQMASDSAAALSNRISLPRWTVYFQGGLLGVVATTFFLLGLMIGQNAGAPLAGSTKMYDCQLTGLVVVGRDSQKSPDEGAVVIVVPVEARLMERPDPQGLRPEDFEAVDNPSIAQIEAIGGRVVRINREGEFDLTLRGPREYFVLVISRQSERAAEEKIPKSTSAEIGGYFFPVEDLIGEKKYHLTKLVLNRRSQNLPTVVF